MNTWVIISGDICPRGGQDKANFALASYLASRGDEVHLVAHSVDRSLAARRGVVSHLVARPMGSHLAGQPLLDRAGRSVARSTLRRHPRARVMANGGNCLWPDLNWVHLVHHAAWAGRPNETPLLARLKNRIGHLYDRRREAIAFSRCRLLFANSDRTRRDLVALGVEPARIRLQYLGCDPNSYGPIGHEEREAERRRLRIDPETAAVVFVGALGRDGRKGFDTLLAAWERLATSKGWRAVLIVAGGGAIEFWQQQAARRGLIGSVRFLGQIQRIPSLLAAADVLCSPTRYEPYGLNVHEALCRGVPAIVTSSAGVAERYGPDMLDLLLPDPDDADALADRLLAWRSARDRYRVAAARMGTGLRAFTWRDMASQMVSAIEASS